MPGTGFSHPRTARPRIPAAAGITRQCRTISLKQRVSLQLKPFLQVRFGPKCLPYPIDRGLRQPRFFRHARPRPMHRICRGGFQRVADDPLDLVHADCCGPDRPGFVEHSVEAVCKKSRAPFSYRWQRDSQPPGDLKGSTPPSHTPTRSGTAMRGFGPFYVAAPTV